MEKKSIGTFLAALRKANGMTQEDVAQRLFVSNKTVSKWERDESSPDLSLIPVLAEMYGVTCDEILRGGRGEKVQGSDDKSQTKTEKQVQRILSHTANQFKSISCISAALTVLGLMLHFAVAYTYFKPLVAFGLGLAFLLGSVVLEIIQLLRTNTALRDGAMLGEDSYSPAAMVPLLHRIAFAVYLLNVWAVILIWPMVSAQGLDYANSVLSFDAYLSQLPMLLVICLSLTLLAAFFARRWLGLLIDNKAIVVQLRYITPVARRIARIQGIFSLGLFILCLMPSAIFQWIGGYSAIVAILFLTFAVTGLAVAAVISIRLMHRSKDRLERMLILLVSVRNVLYGVISVSVINLISISITNSYPFSISDFPLRSIPIPLFQAILITMAYMAVKYYFVKKQKDKYTAA